MEPVKKLAYYNEITDCIKKPGRVPVIFGAIDQQKALFTACVGSSFKNRLIITYNEIRARELYEDYRGFDKNVILYPARDFIFYSANIHGRQLTGERLRAVRQLSEGNGVTIIATIDGCMDRLMTADMYEKHTLNIQNGDDINTEELSHRLTDMGYERVAQTESPGQFAVRGGIIDIYMLTADNPYRIELWDTQVDSIRSFDAQSQRSVENLEQISIFPATELIISDMLSEGLTAIEKDSADYIAALEKEKKIVEAGMVKKTFEELKERILVAMDYEGLESYITYFTRKTASFIDYFDIEDTLFVLDEPNRIEEKMRVVRTEFSESMSHRLEKGQMIPGRSDVLFSDGEIYAKLGSRHGMALSVLDCKIPYIEAAAHYNIDAKGIVSYNNSFETLVDDINKWKKKKYSIVLVSSSKTRAMRLAKNLMDNDVSAAYTEKIHELPESGRVVTVCAKLRKGFEYPDIRFVAIAEDDIFGTGKSVKKKKKAYTGKAISGLSQLRAGDYVVHENHGLGVYRGIEKMEIDKVEKDYIKIEYAGGSNLYILATQLDLIQKYADSEAKKPKLNKLGGTEWSRTKSRVKGAVRQVADELVQLYAARQQKQGFMFTPDTPWQREFEELFPYEETTDQLAAIEDTKKDMESRKIMDRLICGDVGYGKTEIALRAAFKAVQDGKQVAYLVPTTILAKQHFSSFDRRMKDFGVNVRMLSRFCTPKEIKETMEGLKKGLVDVVVGTHRILSKDIVFKDLGLLIIDEEQRFGVTHKERIKQYKDTVDVLTLTATPIPRTLHMSLIGIRDMSVLEEPPVDRLPIQTFVIEYDEEMVREAVNRELARGGQVYYVYNRVQGIDEIALKISRLVPDANVAFAHGQMSERELEKIMVDFVEGDIDVLVSTTIIETGLDIPNVNTIIIHDSDRFGLSQLYQLRGRVGRSGRMAYAFLMYRRDKLLKEVAEKRLSAIREFTDLGSGFKIAMKDLEIRGAGNLLGEQQHGHMESVGYDLYCKMLNEAVSNLKGISTMEDFETLVDLDVDAYVPATYIRSENVKLDMYKRIATIATDEEFYDMADELTDRFGDIPRSAMNLMKIALIKSMAHDIYIMEIKADKKEMKIKMYPKAKINPEKIPDLVKKHGGKMRFTNGEIPYFTYYFVKDNLKNAETYTDCVKAVVSDMYILKVNQENI